MARASSQPSGNCQRASRFRNFIWLVFFYRTYRRFACAPLAMIPVLDETHDPATESWVESANLAGTDFPIQNLPFGVFRGSTPETQTKIGIAIGDRVLDLDGIQRAGLLAQDNLPLAANAGAGASLNSLMSLGTGPRRALRQRVHALLRTGAPASDRK